MVETSCGANGGAEKTIKSFLPWHSTVRSNSKENVVSIFRDQDNLLSPESFTPQIPRGAHVPKCKYLRDGNAIDCCRHLSELMSGPSSHGLDSVHEIFVIKPLGRSYRLVLHN